MLNKTSVLWEFARIPAMEICQFTETDGDSTFDGVVLTILDNIPAEFRYAVTCDRDWRTRSATVDLRSAGRTDRWEIVVSNRVWSCNGVAIPEFKGLVDIDLGFSPCTNTLPIRRLNLAESEHQAFTAAWLRFPELRFERLDQKYTRLSAQRYLYESGGGTFTAELEVDVSGLVITYGDFWKRRSIRES